MFIVKARRPIKPSSSKRSFSSLGESPGRDQEGPNSSFSWAIAIRSLSALRRYDHLLSLYAKMHRSGHHPDPFVISASLKACSHTLSMPTAAVIHAQVRKLGHHADIYAQTSLVDVYSKLEGIGSALTLFDEMRTRNVVSWNSILCAYLKTVNIAEARGMFDEMPFKDVISWNSMVSGYAKAGDMKSAVELFYNMPERNTASWNGMISAFIAQGNMEQARNLFDKMPMRSNVTLVAMISGYSKNGDVSTSEELFKKMDGKDIFSWNAMLACYAQNGFSEDAIHLFNRMRKPDNNVSPDEMTFSSVISACSQLGDLKLGKWVESYISSIGIELDDHLRTAFIDLYSKCGAIDQAFQQFNHLRAKDLIAYTAMIQGCGINGMCSKAFSLFNEMVKSMVAPNSATFIGLLTAYNHAGLVDEGQKCFSSMWGKYRVSPSIDHYAIMVDLLGREGMLEEAHKLIQGMPMKAHVGVWGALLLACRLHSNVELGELSAKNCLDLEPDSSGYHVILANIYAEAGEWEKANRLRKIMSEKGLAKVRGCSWVEPK